MPKFFLEKILDLDSWVVCTHSLNSEWDKHGDHTHEETRCVCVDLPHKPRAVLRAGLHGPMCSKVTNHTGARTPSREGTKEEILFSSQDAFPSRLIKCMIFIVCKRDSLWLEVSTAAWRPPCFLLSPDTISPAPDTHGQCEPGFSKTTIFLRAFALSVPAASKTLAPFRLPFSLWGTC